MRHIVTYAFFGLIAAAQGPAAASAVLTGAAIATDGDSLVVAGERIRLHGVDAFEAEQTCTRGDGRTRACGGEARQALARAVQGATVVCIRRDTDSYGRIVATCRVGETDLGAFLVRRGHALAFRRYSDEYAADEAAARAVGAGLWSDAKVEAPWDWRARQQSGAALAARTNAAGKACDIKGNINRDGAKIYHTRASRLYTRVRAEAVFCTEAEAMSAGFRKAGG
jgi:endonuclease YncB( thermonuclease family)